MEGQSDHHLSLYVSRMTSPKTESTTCPFSCWQLDSARVNVSKNALVCGKPLKHWNKSSLFPMPQNKMTLKKPFIWQVKASEPLHLGLYYYNEFIILSSLHLLWCKPPCQEEKVATTDLKKIYINTKLDFIRNCEDLDRNLHRTPKSSYMRMLCTS